MITDHGQGSYTVSLDPDSTRIAGTYTVVVEAERENDYWYTGNYAKA